MEGLSDGEAWHFSAQVYHSICRVQLNEKNAATEWQNWVSRYVIILAQLFCRAHGKWL